MKLTTSQKRPAVVASDLRFAGSNLRAIGANGEINASSKKDLFNQQERLLSATSSGQVITEGQAVTAAQMAKQHNELIVAARSNGDVRRVIGEKLAESIYMTANRKGYARRLLARHELKQGDIPRFKVSMKNVQAFYSTSTSTIETQYVTDNYLMPPEFQIWTRPFVPQNELNQGTNDVLEEKFVEGLEGIMVAEDKVWYNQAQATIGIDNNRTTIAGTLSPLSLMQVRQNVAQWGLKVAYMVMASDLFVDIVGDASFIQAIEPVARHELVMSGEMAVLYGMTLITEGYRHPQHKVFSAGEFVCVADQQFHGAYSDRGGISSEPTTSLSEKSLGMGWLLAESFSSAIANSRSCAWGRRL